ncbi:MAG: zinc-ribbon domain-containing protein, partial [Actinomycetota bacterium]|nr:zinc-ribbon domain-containing protein [Actinomycetota bacterium]
MVCPTCGNENPAEARFCLECGTALVGSRCASCETPLPAGAKFCLACGAAVQPAEPHAAPAEERRVVSILFVDLVGFTERSDQADPEDVRRTLIPFHERVKEDLERFGGTLDKFIGDAVMGVFGAPVAHEDDPLRAVRSALSILRSMEELRRDDPDLAVRIAVNTGEAVVSFGSGPQVGEAVAGDVVNTASRMQGLAPHGSVVIGESTLRSVRDAFDVELLPAATVKGKAEPLTVWRILGERPSIAADVAPTTFVGRGQELALLRGLFDRAVGSSSLQLVTLIAEPGIGKTRLVEEFRRGLDGGARWLSGHSLPY